MVQGRGLNFLLTFLHPMERQTRVLTNCEIDVVLGGHRRYGKFLKVAKPGRGGQRMPKTPNPNRGLDRRMYNLILQTKAHHSLKISDAGTNSALNSHRQSKLKGITHLMPRKATIVAENGRAVSAGFKHGYRNRARLDSPSNPIEPDSVRTG
jgi:hypothetical protein